jgi:nucleoid DNA-binding protein
MNKDELVKAVAAETKMTQVVTSQAVDAMLDAVSQSLQAREPVTLLGFGTFKVVKRNARKGRNPRTGEPLSIPATTLPSFTPGKTLKEDVNHKG